MENDVVTLATPSNEMDAIDDKNVNNESHENDDVSNTEDYKEDVSEEKDTSDEYDKYWDEDIDQLDGDGFNIDDVGDDDDDDEIDEYGSDLDDEEFDDDNNDDDANANSISITKPLKYRGKEIWVRSEEEAIELMQKGLDYSFKMSKIKPYREVIDILEKSDLSIEDVKALSDVKNGNKDALKYLLKKYNVDFNDLYEDNIYDDANNEESDYKPEINKKNAIEEIYEDIANTDPELAGKVAGVFNSLDDTFKIELNNPNVFMAFIKSVESGEFDKVYPEAIRVKALNPAINWIQAYQIAFRNINTNKNTQTQQIKKPSQVVQPRRNKNKQKRTTTIEEKYDELWSDKYSLEDLEKMIFQ